MYTHRVYGDVGNHYSILEDTSGAVATAAPWLASVVDLAKLANANLADPPNVLVWFRAVGTDLINFKFFKDQVYVARIHDGEDGEIIGPKLSKQV